MRQPVPVAIVALILLVAGCQTTQQVMDASQPQAVAIAALQP